MVLWDCDKALVEQVLEAVVVCLDGEAPPPQVRPPMPYGLDKADELPLISGERAMARRHRPAVERDGMAILDQHRAEAIGRRVALDNEWLGEVRQCQHWGRRHRPFEGTESR
jgi:hypothetical protein